MNALIAAAFVALVATATAAPSGIHGAGAVVSGPAGIVTSHGAIGPAGHGLGLGLGGWAGHGAVVAAPVALAAPVASAVVAGPALGVGLGHGLGLGLGHAGIGLGHAGLGLGHGLALGHGVGAITAGGGTIGVSGHGAAIRGPPTAPVVIAGPSGKVAADGLWGPTANIGLGHGHGHGW